MTPVYTDASSAILLEKTNLFEPLTRVFNVVLAISVFYEITKPGKPGVTSFTEGLRQGQFTVHPHVNTENFKGHLNTGHMDRGEKDTIHLFLTKRDGFILTDDGKAARWCDKHHLPFINALLVPKIFWHAGLMTQKESLHKMNALCRIGRYAKKIKAIAFDCTVKDLAFFQVSKNHLLK